MIILGIDPSLRSTGFGVIEVNGNQMTALCYGHVPNAPKILPSRCLVVIGEKVAQLIDKHQPEVVAVEGLVHVQNRQIAFTLGQVRGVVIATAAKNGLPIYEYAPRKVKQAVTGLGGAGKTQVGNMVKAVLGLPEIPQADAGDALALAICHAHNCRGVQIQPPKQI
ncbi:MAG TPA: crossover junction endodeoxyribonuclease RuvC [Verrucomicrobiae bacterium]|nr:crossover junction endodeoxyribonuclease RuvC [Verrucomicrobiae bacterium]